jgi:hypothetical protein
VVVAEGCTDVVEADVIELASVDPPKRKARGSGVSRSVKT